MRTAWRAKLLSALASLFLTYLILEFLLFPVALGALPLKLHLYVPLGIRTLAQSSKRATIPQHYVALTGDSYAQGRGDWLLEANPYRNSDFHSAHVLHRRTGRDVISLARGGAGALAGLIAFPDLSFRYLSRSGRFHVSPPDVMVGYFYEGNDLHDTLGELVDIVIWTDPTLEKFARPWGTFALMRADAPDYYRRALEDRRLRDPEYFRSAVRSYFLPRFDLYHEAESPTSLNFLYFGRFLAAALKGEIDQFRGEAPRRLWENLAVEGENRVILEGHGIAVPGSLQGPALELTAAETELALYAFEQSLIYLMGEFADTMVCIIYIPSPASVYTFASDLVSTQTLGARPNLFSAREIRAHSSELSIRVSDIVERNGATFVDASSPLRSAASRELLHGPRDWRHFNRKGYTVLGEVVAEYLDAEYRGGPERGVD